MLFLDRFWPSWARSEFSITTKTATKVGHHHTCVNLLTKSSLRWGCFVAKPHPQGVNESWKMPILTRKTLYWRTLLDSASITKFGMVLSYSCRGVTGEHFDAFLMHFDSDARAFVLSNWHKIFFSNLICLTPFLNYSLD